MPLVDSNAAKVGQCDVRKLLLYSGARFSFTPYTRVAICPLSGPIAIAALKDSYSDKSFQVRVLKPNGEQICQIEASHLYQLFWTMQQKLILLSKNGRVLVYTAAGQSYKTFFMDNKTESLDIASAQTFVSRGAITGLACLKSSGQLFVVNDVESPLLWRIVDVSSSTNLPTTWTMIPSSEGPQMVWCTAKCKFFTAGQGKSPTQLSLDWIARSGEYLDMKLAYDGASLALLHSQGCVQVVSSELDQELLTVPLIEVNVQSARILWFNEDVAFLQTGRNTITTFNKTGDQSEFAFDAELHAGAEPDGLTLYAGDSVCALSPVSAAVRRVLGMASAEPGAFLYEASLKFRQRDPQVNDYVQQIGERLPQAVRDCWQAAQEVRSIDEEEHLFAAAVFGQSLRRVAQASRRIEFADHSRHFRILHFLYERGLPLSYKQFGLLQLRGVIDRLIEMRMFAAADLIAQQAEPAARSRIIAHWALDSMDKVSSGLADEAALCERIVQRFGQQRQQVSFAETALLAHEKGLVRLAARLLDLETDVAQQVRALLRLQQQDKALAMCARSQDPDLLYLVIRRLKADKNPRELELILQKVPNVFQMYKELTLNENPGRLLALYKQSDDFRRQALHHLDQLPECTLFDAHKLAQTLQSASEAMSAAGAPNLAALLQQHKQLVQDNTVLEEKYTTSLIDKTVRETLEWAVLKRPQQAEVIRKKHGLTNYQYWQWTLATLARHQLWERLEHFAREQKPPQGWWPLLRLLSAHDQPELAAKFVARLPLNEQAKAWMVVGDIRKACEHAVQQADLQFLRQLRLAQPEESDAHRIVQAAIEELPSAQQPSSSQTR